MLTVIESHDFVRHAKALKLTEGDLHDIISLLTEHPDAGTPLGAGLHKIRIARKGGGKRGGYRIIYFYRTTRDFVYLLDIYAKSKKANASKTEMKSMTEAARQVEKDIK